MDKTKTFAKLLKAHDKLYEAIELLGEQTALTVPTIAPELLDMLDDAEALLNSAVDSDFWQKKGE